MGVDSIGGDRRGNVAYFYGLVDRNGGITSLASGFSWSVLGRTGRQPGIHAGEGNSLRWFLRRKCQKSTFGNSILKAEIADVYFV